MKLLSALLVAALLPAPSPPLEVEGREVSVSVSTDPSECRDNRLLPDPSSSRMVLWEAPRDFRGPIRVTMPSGMSVAEPPQDDQADAPMLVTRVSGWARVEPLRWSAGGDRLLFRVGSDSAVLYEPATRALSAAAPLDPIWRTKRVEAMDHGDTQFYLRPGLLQSLRSMEAEGAPVRTIVTLQGNEATFLAFRSGNGFRFTAYDGARRWETGVPIAFASAPMLPPGAARPLFLGDQAGYSAVLPYALPLVDRTSGRVVGRFGWERIEVQGGRTVDLLPHFNQLMTIQDASANGDTILALVDLEREKRIVRIRGGEVRSWRLCVKRGLRVGTPAAPGPNGAAVSAPAAPPRYTTRPENSLPADAPTVRSLVRFGGRGAPRAGEAFGFLYRPLRADGRLIVYFHGGPTSTLADRTVPEVVMQFARHGISVLAVEQSGMIGGGLALSERLPRLGLRALRRDIAAVTRWAERSGFGRRYLIGDSFGGASGAIAAVEHAGTYEHIFLRAPLLALREPERTVDRRQMLGNNVLPSSQLEFEETVYGGASGRRQFSADLQAYARRLSPSPRLSFYFGTRDPISSITDLPPAFAGHASVRIERASHADVGSVTNVLRDIFSKLGIEPSRRDLGLFEQPFEEESQ
ncbi:MAG TPA: hypothetical protein VGB79_01895 [Allosphingosinicella sp.]